MTDVTSVDDNAIPHRDIPSIDNINIKLASNTDKLRALRFRAREAPNETISVPQGEEISVFARTLKGSEVDNVVQMGRVDTYLLQNYGFGRNFFHQVKGDVVQVEMDPANFSITKVIVIDSNGVDTDPLRSIGDYPTANIIEKHSVTYDVAKLKSGQLGVFSVEARERLDKANGILDVYLKDFDSKKTVTA